MSAESPILISPTLLSPVQAPLSLPSPTDSLGKTQTAIQVDENQQPEQDVIEVKQEEEEIDQIHEEEDDVEHREQEMVVEYEEQKHQEEREVEQGEARRDEEEEVAINDEPLSPSSSLPALWSPKRKHTENDGEQHAVEADEEPVEKRQRVVDAEEVEAEPRRQEEEQLAVVVQQSSSPPAPEHHVVEEKRKMLWSGDLRDQMKVFDVQQKAYEPLREFGERNEAFLKQLVEEFHDVLLEVHVWSSHRIQTLRTEYQTAVTKSLKEIQAEEVKQEESRLRLFRFMTQIQRAIEGLQGMPALSSHGGGGVEV